MYIQYDSLLTDTSQMLCGDDTNLPVLNPELWHNATAHAAWVVASHTQLFSHEHIGFSRVPSDVTRVTSVGPLVLTLVVDSTVSVPVVDALLVVLDERVVVVLGPAVVGSPPPRMVEKHCAVTGVSNPYEPYSTLSVLVM
jgi:hypothetical protein